MTVVDFLVIIPAFRRPDHLRDAIEGALNQPGVTKIILVIDDSPEGSSESAASQFGTGVSYVKMPNATGGWPGLVRNYGLEHAARLNIDAFFVHFLDDDDIPAPGIYSDAKMAFQKEPVGVVFGAMKPFCDFSSDSQTRDRQKDQLLKVSQWQSHIRALSTIYAKITSFSRPLGQWLFRSQYLYSHELFLCSAAMIRYSRVGELSGFDTQTRITEDYEFYTRAINSFGVFYLNKVSVFYRTGSTGALWNPLALEAAAEREHKSEVAETLRKRKERLRAQLGMFRFLSEKLLFRLALFLLNRTVVKSVRKQLNSDMTPR
ncbi:MAG: glycosyltransferase [Methylovirgula sp.]|uniref:glycosyltransferase family 2 protein n=1 Tax=Methylovirgula sp. TaxID=1978224 RepID=UPI0030766C20